MTTEMPDVAMTIPDSATDQADADNTKRAAAPGNSPDKKKLKGVPKACPSTSLDRPMGFEHLDVGGSGDCAYRAASVAYALATGRPLAESKTKATQLGNTLRAQVASHLRKHGFYRESWSPDNR